MTDLIVACVRTGTRYDFSYVTKLRNMVARNLDLPYTMVCLTDQPERCTGVAFVDISVMPEHRGHGIGSALLRRVLAEGTVAGIPVGRSRPTCA